jgi:hypothetical protein
MVPEREVHCSSEQSDDKKEEKEGFQSFHETSAQ